ncbi:MAG: adenylosuccinate lyase [Deltaproteobacteria bacterium]|nr:adenylosuccinate lyase [Deltaproteobacteria bacterium]
MIERYTREEMGRLWTDQSRFSAWLKVEVLACRAWAELGRIPVEAVEIIEKKAGFTVDRIFEIEKETRHDVIAFLTSVAEHVGPESRYIHLGLTSSDVLDTSFAWLLKEAGGILIKDLDALLSAIKTRAFEHKYTPMMGRSHGIHAEPITFGLKLSVWYEEMKRNRKRLEAAINCVAAGKISGAVGTFANIDPRVEEYVCEKLGLVPEPASTQIVQRDRHAEFFTALALCAASVEKIALEIRHLQRTEVGEAEEFFSKGQKGSSAMPHKRNPIGSENLCGLSRVVRANAFAAMENVALWHERDISHSSVERVIGPDSTILLDYMLARLTGLIEKLVVYPEKMAKNLALSGGLIFSQQVLLLLAEAGFSREDAYRLVQSHAMKAWSENGDFKAAIFADPEISALVPREKLDEVFDVKGHLKHVDFIFNRVFA